MNLVINLLLTFYPFLEILLLENMGFLNLPKVLLCVYLHLNLNLEKDRYLLLEPFYEVAWFLLLDFRYFRTPNPSHWFCPYLHYLDLTLKFHQLNLYFNLTPYLVFNEVLKWRHKTNLNRNLLSQLRLMAILALKLQIHVFLMRFETVLDSSTLFWSVHIHENKLQIIEF